MYQLESNQISLVESKNAHGRTTTQCASTTGFAVVVECNHQWFDGALREHMFIVIRRVM